MAPKRAPARAREEEESEEESPRPTARSQRNRRRDEDESDDAEEFARTQSTQGRQLTGQQRQQFGVDLARYMLFNEKHRLPVSRTKISDDIVPKEARVQRSAQTILPVAKELLQQAFGFELVPIMRTRGARGRGATQATQGKATQSASQPTDFILLADAPPDVPLPGNSGREVTSAKFKKEVEEFDKVEKAHREKRVKLDWSEDGPQLGLVAVIVGLIDMEGTSIEEDVLWQRLGVLGIDKQRVHDVFGDVRNLVETQFVRELYLVRQPMQNTEGVAKFEVSRGPRADAEMPALHLARFLFRILNRPLDFIALRAIAERTMVAADEEVEDDASGPAAAAAGASQPPPPPAARRR